MCGERQVCEDFAVVLCLCVIDGWPVCDWVQSATWPSGKGLGGTSLLNYMQYLRGSRHDYDAWANSGAAGWAYKDVLPYFIKAEDQQNGEFVRTGWRSSQQPFGNSSVLSS